MVELGLDTREITAFAKALALFPTLSTEHMRRGMLRIGERHIARHRQKQLAGRPGLNRVTGGMIQSRRVEVEVGSTSNPDSVNGKLFIGPPAAKYARVHEYGATIKPKVAKVLKFQVGGQTVYAKHVTIPARLGWASTWDTAGEDRAAEIRTMLRGLLRDIASRRVDR